jgi:hypothetical protein
MIQNFVATFLFEIHHPIVDQDLQVVRQKFFEEAPKLPVDQNLDQGSNFCPKIKVFGITSKWTGA